MVKLFLFFKTFSLSVRPLLLDFLFTSKVVKEWMLSPLLPFPFVSQTSALCLLPQKGLCKGLILQSYIQYNSCL